MLIYWKLTESINDMYRCKIKYIQIARSIALKPLYIVRRKHEVFAKYPGEGGGGGGDYR